MKRTTVSIVILVCLVAVLFISTAFNAVSSVNAQLGNTGVPVRCQAANVNVNVAQDLSCTVADGTLFGSNITVPTGHYLLVTDIYVHPWGTGTGEWTIVLDQFQGTTLKSFITLSTLTRSSFAEHFTTPAMWLSEGQHLQVFNYPTSPSSVDFYIYGLLTTNVAYAPMIAR